MMEPIKIIRKAAALIAILLGVAIVALNIGAVLREPGSMLGLGSKRSMLAVGGLTLLLGGIVSVLPKAMRRIGQGGLLLVTTAAVVLAADLLTKRSAAGFDFESVSVRLFMLTLVSAGLWLGGLIVLSPQEPSPISASLSGWKSAALRGGRFLGMGLLLGLLALLMHQYHIENPLVHHNLMLLVFYGFLVHHLLDMRFRLSFFLLLSLACILCVFGAVNGACLIAIGLLLVGICHLPLSFGVRVGLLLLTGGVLALLRADRLHAPWSGAIWPILGSMFMFRLIVYMYDRKHQKEPVRLSQALSYFFLFPNIAFPLFPVIDYSTFRRTYYDKAPYTIYHTGVAWMYLGVLHLILYRLVYYYLSLAPNEVHNAGELLRFLVANFLLYLRISGQFHLIVGMLHLFGFNLPVTHHLYFFSSSFTDFWRRINIYWKDFMMKIFYMPTYFRLRKIGTTAALILSTLFVFFITWVFHAYQWFWLRGTFLLSTVDMLFWAVLAVLVLVNSLWETNRGRERALVQRAWNLREMTPIIVRTVGTFGFICVLWSLWTSASLGEWFALWSGAGLPMTGAGLLLPIAFLGLVVLGETLRLRQMAKAVPVQGRGEPKTPAVSRRLNLTDALTAVVVAALLVIGNERVYGRLAEAPRAAIRDLTEARLNARDAALLQRGYYEDLMGVERFNSELWQLYADRPTDWKGLHDILPETGDYFEYRLPPNVSLPYRGKTLSTNQWGMRDKPYDKKKPSGTYRIALLGSSHVMGYGVENNEIFEALLEERLNSEKRSGPYVRCEILNFAMSGYAPLQELLVLEDRVLAFEPDAVFYFASPHDLDRSLERMVVHMRKGEQNPLDFAREIEQRAGINKTMAESEGAKRLKPFRTELLTRTYQRIVKQCKLQNSLPVWIFMPDLEAAGEQLSASDLQPIAAQAGFMTLDMSRLYDRQDRNALTIADWDWHPNAQGHRLIADFLYELLREHGDRIPLGLSPLTSTVSSIKSPLESSGKTP